MPQQTVLVGNVLDRLRDIPDASVHCCVTSPPYYGLRDYGVKGQIGLEPTLAEYVASLVAVFREVRRVLRDDGTCWVNIGDSYNAYNGNRGTQSEFAGKRSVKEPSFPSGNGLGEKTLKQKDLMMVPARVAIALCDDGWYLRSDIIWAKPNPMPESVTDRPTSAHEHVFLLSKSPRYYYDADSIAESAAESTAERAYLGKRPHGPKQDGLIAGGMHGVSDTLRVYDRTTRNKRNVWSVSTTPFPGAHFATFPPKLVEPMILAGCPEGGTILDPFLGAGTTLLVADRLGRNGIGIELNPEYAEMARRRITDACPMFAAVDVA